MCMCAHPQNLIDIICQTIIKYKKVRQPSDLSTKTLICWQCAKLQLITITSLCQSFGPLPGN